MDRRNTYTVVFRCGTVVVDRLVNAKTMSKAAKKAEKKTRPGRPFDGHTVYSITLGVRS